jgi:hypothetical protein
VHTGRIKRIRKRSVALLPSVLQQLTCIVQLLQARSPLKL